MASGNPETCGAATFRRTVFYLAGFDPRGARFYHQLLGGEIARANAADGQAPGEGALTLSPRQRDGENVAWTVATEAGSEGGQAVETSHVFLVWDDIVRANWARGPLAVFGGALTAYRGFCTRMSRRLLGQSPRGSRFTLYYPGATLFALPLLAVLLLWLALRLMLPGASAMLPTLLALAGGGLAALLILQRIHSLWLLRFVMFNDRLARAAPDGELARRLDAFAARIGEALADEQDEVLFVTHSNGSILAVPIMARLLERHAGTLPDRFSLVTLGGCIPLLAVRKDAGWFHALLDRLGAGGFRWLDIGSLTDGAATPLVAPCLGRAIERPPGLVQLSPRWFRYADPATYKLRRSNKYETHFDYLRRLDRPSPLDYLAITCSDRRLAASIDAFVAETA